MLGKYVVQDLLGIELFAEDGVDGADGGAKLFCNEIGGDAGE